ncbi:PAAR domain-containing protein [Paracoccus caeni]|uniref:PAAR domain-containing protein n=1 Tax=Paracoccus caeni TaxID=657651 RepID=A0A934SIR0_9RHOB|nr:PAAR domain-containing protein [Paracoccus caeni]MBK4218245.1 PAAR domain-containing protein [Paracoccus caeni]
MGKPIALVGHLHSCPIHGGGPVMNPGQAFVRLNGIPLAVEGGHCGCPGTPPLPDPMVRGSGTVRINGRGVMRVRDQTAHGGKILTGVPTFNAD